MSKTGAARTSGISLKKVEKVKKAILVLVVFAGINVAQAADSFSVGGGFGSSVAVSGGSQATAGGNGNGYSQQTSNSQASGFAVGGTGMAAGVGVIPAGFAVVAGGAGISGSFGVGGSQTTAGSAGYTGGDGYGSTKSGAGVDYSSYGNSGLAASYSYAR